MTTFAIIAIAIVATFAISIVATFAIRRRTERRAMAAFRAALIAECESAHTAFDADRYDKNVVAYLGETMREIGNVGERTTTMSEPRPWYSRND
jgi:hypothetical protein